MRTVYPKGTTFYKPELCYNGYTLLWRGSKVKLIDMNGRAEVLARAKNVDEAIDKFRRLQETPNSVNSNNHVKIVKGDKTLIEHLEGGWELVKELNHGKYLLRSA